MENSPKRYKNLLQNHCESNCSFPAESIAIAIPYALVSLGTSPRLSERAVKGVWATRDDVRCKMAELYAYSTVNIAQNLTDSYNSHFLHCTKRT